MVQWLSLLASSSAGLQFDRIEREPETLGHSYVGGNSAGSALSRTSVTGALAGGRVGAVSLKCGDEVVVSSLAAPSVRDEAAL